MPSPQATSFSNTRKVLSQLENLLKCTVCKTPATSPVTLGGCEHIFCSVCCDNYLGRCCPVCDLPAHVKDADVDRQLFNMATLCGRLKEILDDIKDKDISKPDLVGDSIYCTPDQGIIDTEPVVGPYKNTETDFTKVIEKTSKTNKKTNKRKGKEREEDMNQVSLKETDKVGNGRDFGDISATSVDNTNVEQAMQKGPCIEKNLKPTKSARKKQKTGEEKLPEAEDKVGQNPNLTGKSVRNRRKGVKKVESTAETERTDDGTEIENERTITDQSLDTNEATSVNLLSESKPHRKKDGPNITCKSRKPSRQRKSTGSIEKQALSDSHKTGRNRAVKRYSLQSSATEACESNTGETLKDQTHEEQQIDREENEPTTILKKNTRRSKAISVNMTESGTGEKSQKRKPADMNTSILPDVSRPDDNKTRKKKRWTLNGQVESDKSEQGAPLVSNRKEKENSNTSTVKAKSRRISSPGLNKRNAKGETLLHVAAIKNDVPKVLELLEKGANPNVRDNAGWTPLHEACNHGYTEVAKLLLDHGAMINVPGFENDSPLHDAVSNNRLDCVQLLVSRGASTSARNLHGLTPIDYAKTREMKEALNSQVTEPMKTDKETIDVLEYQQPCLLGTGLSREEKTMLQKTASQLKVKLTEEVTPEVTHILTKCNTEGMCPRTVKIVQGILSGKWILNLEWLTLCREMNSLVCEEAFEVQGLSMFPYCKSPCKGRMNRKQQLPGLFDGCWFYFHGDFEYAVPSKEDLSATIKIGGGKILAREPKPGHLDETTLTVPYHADSESELKDCCTFVIFETGSKHQPIRTKYICSVPASWVIDCAATFTLLPLPES